MIPIGLYHCTNNRIYCTYIRTHLLVGRMRGLEEKGGRANWFYYRDGNEWSYAREKTKRDVKTTEERCLLTDVKMCTLQLMTILGKLYII